MDRDLGLFTEPPDSNGAAGPTSYVETVNQTVAIYSPKATGAGTVADNLAHFFGTTGGLLPADSAAVYSDPGAIYDDNVPGATPTTGRFIVTDENVDDAGASVFDIAISKSPSPATLTTADWSFYQITTTEAGGLFADYPGNFGYNQDALVVTFDMRDQRFVQHFQVDAVSISDMVNGVPQSQLRHTQADLDAAVRPATEHDAASGAPEWLVAPTGDGMHISVYEMTNLLTGPSFALPPPLAVTLAFSGVQRPLQPDGSTITGIIQSRIEKAAESNNTLVAAIALGGSSTQDVIQWYKIDVSSGTPVLSDEGQVDAGPNTYLVYPAIDINSSGDIGLTYTRSGTDSATDFMSAYVTGRTPSDPPGTMETPIIVPAGTGTVNDTHDGREGDLSGISVDPVDGSFWAATEFATPSTVFHQGSWGTSIANFRPSTTSTVLNNNDSGPGSLRAEIAAAQNGDTINFDNSLAGQTITLTGRPLNITSNVTIDGPSGGVTISGGGVSQVFTIIGDWHTNTGPTVAMDNLTVTGGNANQSGGGIFNEYGSNLTLTKCIVENNQAAQDGGGIENEFSAVLTLSGCTINGNISATGGGGVDNNAGSTLIATKSTFNSNAENSSSRFGGGILNENSSTVTLTDCQLKNNQGPCSGIGLANMFNSTAQLSNCWIDSNEVPAGTSGPIGGGGILNYTNSTIALDYCSVTNNSDSQGGGILSQGSQLTLSFCWIDGNSATSTGLSAGGGILIDDLSSGAAPPAAPLTMVNSIVSSNQLEGREGLGAGIDLFNLGATETITLANDTVENNADQTGTAMGGGLFISSAGAVNLTNCTIAGNSAGVQGGGLFVANEGSVNLVNCTVAGNVVTANATITANLGPIGYLLGNAGAGICSSAPWPFSSQAPFPVAVNSGGPPGGLFWGRGGKAVIGPFSGTQPPPVFKLTLQNTLVAFNGDGTDPHFLTWDDIFGAFSVLSPSMYLNNLILPGFVGSNQLGGGTLDLPALFGPAVDRPFGTMLEPLQNNGGPMVGAPGHTHGLDTMALIPGPFFLKGSDPNGPAIWDAFNDAIDNGTQPNTLTGLPTITDERGVARDLVNPDIGAFEQVTPLVSDIHITFPEGTTGTQTIVDTAIQLNAPQLVSTILLDADNLPVNGALDTGLAIVTLDAQGNFLYTPKKANGWVFSDSFAFEVGLGGSTSTVAHVFIEAPAPVATRQQFPLVIGIQPLGAPLSVSGSLLTAGPGDENDKPTAPYPTETLTVRVVDLPKTGMLSGPDPMTGEFTYISTAAHPTFANDSFGYVVNDGVQDSLENFVILDPTIAAPVLTSRFYKIREDAAVQEISAPNGLLSGVELPNGLGLRPFVTHIALDSYPDLPAPGIFSDRPPDVESTDLGFGAYAVTAGIYKILPGTLFSVPNGGFGYFPSVNFDVTAYRDVQFSYHLTYQIGGNGASPPVDTPSIGLVLTATEPGVISDSAGIADATENAGPNGGDGNGDGIPDVQQDNVASLPDAADGSYVTLVSPQGTGLIAVSARANPSPKDAPANVTFPEGFFGFSVAGVQLGGSTTVTMLLPPGARVSGYWRYGPTADLVNSDGTHPCHWYEWDYDSNTGVGAQFTDPTTGQPLIDPMTRRPEVILHFVDGQLGDDDLTANGVIADVGTPALSRSATVSGTVFNDVNRDALKESGEPGLQGWNVGQYDAYGNLVLLVTTDANGSYSFTHVLPGDQIREDTQYGWWEDAPAHDEWTMDASGADGTGIDFGDYRSAILDILFGGAASYTSSAGIASNLSVALTNGTYSLTDSSEPINVLGSGAGGWSGDGTNTVAAPAASLSSLSVFTAQGQPNVVSLLSTGVPVTLNPNGGSNTFNITLGSLDGLVTIGGMAYTDRDTLNVYAASGTNYIVKRAGQITWGNPATETVNYSGVTNLVLDLTPGSNNTVIDPGSQNATIIGGPGVNNVALANTVGSGVVFQDGGGTNNIAVTLGSLAWPVTLNGTTGANQVTATLPAGNNVFTLTGTQLSGDGQTVNFNLGSTLTALTIDGTAGNNQLVPSGTVPAPLVLKNVIVSTTCAVSASANAGQPVNLTAVVTPVIAAAGPPTGQMQFRIDGKNFGAPVSLAGGSAVHSTAALSAGAHTVVAVYGGDSDFLTSNSPSITIQVSPVPVAVADVYSAFHDKPLIVAAPGVLANDADPEGRKVSAIAWTAVAHGRLVPASNGGFQYVPAPGFVGTDSFTYDASDGSLTSPPATVTINVINAPPTIAHIPDQTVNEGSTLSFKVAASDPDEPRSSLTFSLDKGAPAGAKINPRTGVFTFPAVDGPAVCTVTVRVSDNFRPAPESSAATFRIVVANVPPVLTINSVTTGLFIEGTAIWLRGTVGDPGPLDSMTLAIDWDDGSTMHTSYAAGRVQLFSLMHQYNEAGIYIVTLTATDKDGGQTVRLRAIHVTDAALYAFPQVITEVTDIPFGAFVIQFQDSNPFATVNDYLTVVINWGDGASFGSVLPTATGFEVYGTHVYTHAGGFAGNVTVVDQGGSVITSFFVADVLASAPRAAR
jgi:hypothetical protein